MTASHSAKQDMNNSQVDYDPIGNMSVDSVLLSPMPPNWEAMNFSFNLWKTAQAEQWGVCTQRPSNHAASPSENETNGYLMIAVAGGLNQMRLGVCDAVVVARLLNATLLLPQFDNESWWGDQSKFEDVFDVNKFITTLAPDVRVLPELPKSLKDMPHFTKTVPRHSTLKFYLMEMLPLLKRSDMTMGYDDGIGRRGRGGEIKELHEGNCDSTGGGGEGGVRGGGRGGGGGGRGGGGRDEDEEEEHQDDEDQVAYAAITC
ncbi:hypothetical protein CBR_g23744 [Chara braunii]|uniref:O-fucosyltransferase family protein n=1 Tax=Chara braunii TaxID=69332 RepID=A0A388JVH6_CHABU|nr:hypothetical protein CBR_g23744 [Chara braunii]|eukprot:GBG61785.1 hypothetical protein CBR_g23744 [Chara braunii]